MTYYVVIHYGSGGQYIDGVVVPNADSALHAISQVKSKMLAQLHMYKCKPEPSLSDITVVRQLEDRLTALKRPWRIPNRRLYDPFYANPYAKGREIIARRVDVYELRTPVRAGGWLDITLDGHQSIHVINCQIPDRGVSLRKHPVVH